MEMHYFNNKRETGIFLKTLSARQITTVTVFRSGFQFCVSFNIRGDSK